MANEFVIKNGYFSQGNSNVTGSLQVTGSVGVTGSASITGSLTSIGTSTFSGSVLMTGSLNAIVSGAIDLTGFITASKIFITSSGNEQLMVIGSGSDSWITGIYGSQGNLLTVTDTFSGSIFTVSDISGYPILDIISDYYTSSVYLPTLQSQSQQHVVVYNSQSGLLSYVSASAIGGGSGDPFPYTGSAEITGSLIVSGGFITHDPLVGFDIINSDLRYLYDGTGIRSILWQDRVLKDSSEANSLIWGDRTLINSAGVTVGDWEAQRFWDAAGNRSLDWNNRTLYDSAANSVFDWNTPGEIIVTDNIVPGGTIVDNTSSYDLGSPTAAWNKIYVSNNSLHFVSGSITSSIGFNDGIISFNDAIVNIPTGSIVPTASYTLTASSAINSITSSYPISINNGAIYSVLSGRTSTGNNNAIFLGASAGSGVTTAYNSNFIGYLAGQSATIAYQSNFIGAGAGTEATKADNSNFMGLFAGYKAVSASFSTLIGWQAGQTNDPTLSVGTNNIIIGNNITLPSKSRDSINLGGIIFATGSYSTLSGDAYSGTQYNIGRVGINKVTPQYTLDVSGSGNYSNGLTVTGSLTATSFTGSLQGTASWAESASNAVNAQTASFLPVATYNITASWANSASQALTASFIQNAQTASYVLNAVSASYVLQAVSASFASTASFVQTAQTASYVTGSIFTNANPALSASYALTSSYALNGGVTQIVAGTNISITNGGSGSVTINSTGGGGSGAGANVTASFTNQSTWTFTHGLGNRGVVVQTFDTSWNQTIPQSITLTDSNTATIVFPLNQSGFAIASLGGVVSTAATASYVLNAVSSSFASTASFVNTLNQNVIITGSVAIGTGSVGNGENNLLLGPAPAGGTGEGGQMALLAAGGSYTSSSFIDNWQNQFRILRGPGAVSNAGLLYMDLQTGNTNFIGAVTASGGYSGLPNAWLHAMRSGNQTIGSGTWADRDIIFNSVSSNNFTYNSTTGIATLKANKTYRITARLAWSAAGLYTLKFRIYNQTTSAFTGPTVELIQSPNGTYNVSDGTLEMIFNVGASDTDISIRTTADTNALTGEYIRGDLNTQLIIQQIA